MSTATFNGEHHRASAGSSIDWATPIELVRALGTFDLDPAGRPGHHTAAEVWAERGLTREWFGRVWCNPPYGAELRLWLRKLADHGNGIALTFARTETRAFSAEVWARADALLFVRGRLWFLNAAGVTAGNAGAPSVLIAYGAANVAALEASGIAGELVKQWCSIEARAGLGL